MRRLLLTMLSAVAVTIGLGLSSTAASASGPTQTLVAASDTQPISVENYKATALAAGIPIQDQATIAATQCWQRSFSVSKEILWHTYVQYGFTGKWCWTGTAMWQMAVISKFIHTPAGVWDKRVIRILGRGVQNGYAFAVVQFAMSGTIAGQTVYLDGCIRAWGDRWGNSNFNEDCSV